MTNFKRRLLQAQNNTKPRETTKALYRSELERFAEWVKAEGLPFLLPDACTVGSPQSSVSCPPVGV